ncbi:UbiX family flavin prenyltransferase [Hippea alviniae]|uniref:UbiX family flavin prenyltransferase n=1 Tax=Hippea alviniae TaxID=1279027 RepID=UPI0003B63654|nr:UbiX family flavin prenyltransferase [Hippea alviniae]
MKIAVLISGASGSILSKRLIEVLNDNHELFVVASDEAKWIFKQETEEEFDEFIRKKKCKVFKNSDFSSPLASGSFKIDAGIIIPCSVKTLSAVACGYASNLITRCADVCIKEKRKLIMVVRETPLSPIHLENMLKLSKIGVVILPPMLTFYNKPKNLEDAVDFVIGKLLDQLNLHNNLFKRWE